MGTKDRGPGADSEPASGAEEWPAAVGLLPSYWPQRVMDAVVAEAALPPPRGHVEAADPLWERWFERAVEEGVEEDLATLGRSLIREARLLGFRDERLAQCGWMDEGEAMLQLALLDPEAAEEAWHTLLDDDAA
jgi:hypothetical protein